MNAYPCGGRTAAQGGGGMFRDAEGHSIHVWIDINIINRYPMLKQMEIEGAKIAVYHQSPEVQLIILSPRSIAIFDMYCHPSWLTPSAYAFYKARQARAAAKGVDFAERWRSKVMLKETWWKECIKAGRFLGDADDWGGQRAGGPPSASIDTHESSKLPLGAPHSPGQVRQFPAEGAAWDPKLTPFTDTAQAHSDAPPKLGDSPAIGQLQAVTTAQDPTTSAGSASGKAIAPSSYADTTTAAHRDDSVTLGSGTPDRQRAGPPDTDSAGLTIRSFERTDTLGHAGAHDHEEEEEVEEVEEVENKDISGAGNESLALAHRGSSGKVNEAFNHAQRGEPAMAPSPIDPRVGTLADLSCLFDGFRLWVDPKRPNRSDLLGRIKRAGGIIAADYPNATHVLVHDYGSNAKYWDGVMKTLTKKGVWFMHMTWATKSLDNGALQHELAHSLPGGGPAAGSIREAESDSKPLVSTSPALPAAQQAVDSLDKSQLSTQQKALEKFFNDVDRSDDETDTRLKDGTERTRKKKKREADWPDFVPKTPREQGLEEAYQTALVTQAYRKNSSEDVIKKSGISDRKQWLVAYAAHVEKRAASKMSDARLLEILESVQREFEMEKQHSELTKKPKAERTLLLPLLHALVQKYGVYDFDGWIDLHDRWRRGKWPVATSSESATPNTAAHGPGSILDNAVAVPQLDLAAPPARPAPLGFAEVPPALQPPSKSATELPVHAAARPDDNEPDGTFAKPIRLGLDPPERAVAGTEVAHADAAASGKRISREELANIMCDNHERLVDLGIYRVGLLLAGQFPEYPRYTAQKWALIANEWEHGLGRFVKLGKQYDPSGNRLAAKKAALAARRSNTKQGEPGDLGAAPATTKGKHPVVSTEDMDRIFRQYSSLAEQADGLSPTELGSLLEKNHGGYSAATWSNRYRQWIRGEGRFAAKGKAAARPAETNGTKRSHDSPPSGSQPPQSKRPKNAYTEEEERRMAAYIVARLPEVTLPRPQDWRTFAEANPGRSLAGYAEHYRGYKARIDGYVRDIQDKQGRGDRAISVGSEDSSVVALESPEKRQAELIDITLLDDDDE